MDATAFVAVALACAPRVHVTTVRAIVTVESSGNPWAIGVVGGQLERQPRNLAEAQGTAKALQTAGWNFSVGLGQINVRNLARLGLTLEQAFEPCANLAALQTVLLACFQRARDPPRRDQPDQAALRRALSCYYSGDFATGFRDHYVHRVVVASADAGLIRLTVSGSPSP